MNSEKIDIVVGGRRLSVEIHDLNPLEVQALAQRLSERMEAISRETEIVDSHKLAIQAALESLQESSRLQAASEDRRVAENLVVDRLIAALEAALGT